jgi:pilus assembly protein Flp/PilA
MEQQHAMAHSESTFTVQELTMTTVSRFLVDESGATAIEYGLIAALIAVGIIAAATTLGGSLSAIFGRISTKLNAAT